MELAITLPLAEGAMSADEVVELSRLADELEYHSIWAAEAWSFDAFVLLTSLIPSTSRIGLGTAIINVYSRTPALIGQSAAALDALSGGRAIVGLGASGPQVIEGWHGMPYVKPLRRTRETIEIVRMILGRQRLNYNGEIFHLDMGLKLINHPIRANVPIIVASLGPKNVEMTAEIADGWMPTLYSPTKGPDVFRESIKAGERKRSPGLAPLQTYAQMSVSITDRPEPGRAVMKSHLALYIGGMGSREQNFYNRLAKRYGYSDEAATIQDLYLSGKRQAAAEAVPDSLVEDLTAIGPKELVRDKLAEFAEAGVDVLMLSVMAEDHAGRLAALEEVKSLL